MTPITLSTEIIDGLLILGLAMVTVIAFFMSRKASDKWDDDELAKH